MLTIEPSDHRLRRLHAVDVNKLATMKTLVGRGGLPPIYLIKFRQPTSAEVYIVADGTHRVQAALELGLDRIEYVWKDIRDARREARTQFRDFDDLAHAARKFRVGEYSFY